MAPRKKKSGAVARKPRSKSLLIVHCDIERLRQDGLDMIGPSSFAGILAAAGLNASSCRIATTTERTLLDHFAKFAEDGRRFDVIVLIGHSNQHGLKIASDRFASWDALAGYLRPLEPRRLVVVACEGGRFAGINSLFKSLPKLRRIYGSPIGVSRDLATLLLFFVPYVVEVKAPSRDAMQRLQAAALFFTKRPVWEWRRTHDLDNPDGQTFDLLGDLLKSLLT